MKQRLNELLDGDAAPWSEERHRRVRDCVVAPTPSAARTRVKRIPRAAWLVAAAILVVASGAFAAVRFQWFVASPSAPPPAPTTAGATTTSRVRVHPQEGARFAELGAEHADGDEVVRVFDGVVTIELVAEEDHVARALTGDAEISAREASFDLSVSGDRLRSLRIISGRVELRLEGQPVQVLEAGERFVAVDDPKPVASSQPVAPSPPDATAAVPSARARVVAPARPNITPRPSAPKAANADERAFNAAWSAIERGDYEAAEKDLGKVSPNSPLAEDAAYWRAVSLVRAGDKAKAREALTRFIAQHPDSPRKAEAEGLLQLLKDKD